MDKKNTAEHLLIYVEQSPPRLIYTFKHVFKYLLGVPYELTSDLQQFVSFCGPKLSYTKKQLSSDLHIHAQDLLFEKGVDDPELELTVRNGKSYIFEHQCESDLTYDPFAAIFFFISRYEEYMIHCKDSHQRFPAEASFASEHQLLHKPVVDLWALELLEVLLDQFPHLVYKKRKFKAVNTIDVDQAFSIKEKGFIRTSSILLRSLLSFKFSQFRQQISVLLGKSKDPFDTFSFIFNKTKLHPKIEHRFFVLLGDYGTYDKNIHPRKKAFKSLIKSMADYAFVGIHPSYRSNETKAILKEELLQLKQLIHRGISSSRQHYLKLELPKTYRHLIDLGISEDYTMGFASQSGFRAGTCTPFYFYDLDLEYETPLLVHPFCVMEASLKHYQGLDPEEAKAHINMFIKEVKQVEGTFISLWHNESLSENELWKGWKSVYVEMLKACDETLA
ncbi:MAG: polysaccharide deacetylase family protein [Flavobacteriales bacterium]